jgi:hypothetical protein
MKVVEKFLAADHATFRSSFAYAKKIAEKV